MTVHRLKEFTHLPTTVGAIRVSKPYSAVEKTVPFAHRVTKGSGAFSHFRISNPGSNVVHKAELGDWIVRFPSGTYWTATDEQFRAEYGVDPDLDIPAEVFATQVEEDADGSTVDEPEDDGGCHEPPPFG